MMLLIAIILYETDNYIELIWFDLINSSAFMFYKCSNITEIDLSNFNTSQVILMNSMFSYCSSLTSLNFSNFNTSKVTYMQGMFNNCSSLTSLNLSNFITSKATNINDMFKNCINLEYIIMINFNEINLSNSNLNMFQNIPNNIVVCINITNIQNKIYPQIKSKACHIEDCTDNWKSKQNKYIENLIDDLFNKSMKKEEKINKYNMVLDKIELIFTSDNYNLTDIDNGKDLVINANKILITLTNIENQKNNIESNMSTIDLGKCEIILRNYYNLTNNQTIYIKKLDIIQDGMKAKKVEYNIYSNLSGKI